MTFLATGVWLAFIAACVWSKAFWRPSGQLTNPVLRGLVAFVILFVGGVLFYIVGFIMLYIGKFLLLPVSSLLF